MPIVLVELDYRDPDANGGAGADLTLRLAANEGYMTGRSDTPPDVFFAPRLSERSRVRRDAFGNGTTRGPSSIGYGDVVAANNDGGLDWATRCVFNGREARIWYGEPGAAFPAAWKRYVTATQEGVEIGWEEVRWALRDKKARLSKPVQTNRYAGTNSLPNGQEGTASDLKGLGKPQLWGHCREINPACANTSKLEFQVNAGAFTDLPAVADRGVTRARTTPDYANVAAMDAGAPPQGNYQACASAGYFRLGSVPVGQTSWEDITCEAIEGATAADRTPAKCWGRVLEHMGFAAGEISSADITALDAVTSAEVGYFARHQREVPALEVLDMFAASARAATWEDRLGVMRIKRIAAPSGTPAVVFDDKNLLSMALRRSDDPGFGVPAFRVSVGYRRYWTVRNPGSLAGSVTEATRAQLGQEYRWAKVEDLTIRDGDDGYPDSPELFIETALDAEADAQALAQVLFDQYSVPRDSLDVVARVTPAEMEAIDIGVVVQVRHERLGYGEGKLFVVVGDAIDVQTAEVSAALWG